MTIFFNISFLNFVKIYGPQKICKTRHLAPLGWWQGPTAAPHGGTNARGTVAPATAVGHDSRSPVCFKKNVIFLFNSDGDKLYMKIVAFVEIYNFVVQFF
jgi:hypothetical protein